jgi:hypothetical protein
LAPPSCWRSMGRRVVPWAQDPWQRMRRGKSMHKLLEHILLRVKMSPPT